MSCPAGQTRQGTIVQIARAGCDEGAAVHGWPAWVGPAIGAFFAGQ